jgi:copper chaperone CopZ
VDSIASIDSITVEPTAESTTDTSVALEREVKQVLDALSYYYQREEGKDLTSNALTVGNIASESR